MVFSYFEDLIEVLEDLREVFKNLFEDFMGIFENFYKNKILRKGPQRALKDCQNETVPPETLPLSNMVFLSNSRLHTRLDHPLRVRVRERGNSSFFFRYITSYVHLLQFYDVYN